MYIHVQIVWAFINECSYMYTTLYMCCIIMFDLIVQHKHQCPKDHLSHIKYVCVSMYIHWYVLRTLHANMLTMP